MGVMVDFMCQCAEALTRPQLSNLTPAQGLLWKLFVDMMSIDDHRH